MKHAGLFLIALMIGCWLTAILTFVFQPCGFQEATAKAEIERHDARFSASGTADYWTHLDAAADYQLTADRMQQTRMTAVLVFMFLAIYPAPIAIALLRRHRPPQFPAFLMVSILLGWTIAGWLAALIWSVWQSSPRESALAVR